MKYGVLLAVALFVLTLIGCSAEEAQPDSQAMQEEAAEQDVETATEAAIVDEAEEPATAAEPEAQVVGSESDQAGPESVEEEQQPAADEVADTDGGLPEGVGREQFEEVCFQCHSLDIVIAQRRTDEEWTAVIQEMISLGADASNTEAGMIWYYLTENFGQ